MLRVALKGLLGHKLRFALTTLAVVVGVTFLAGSYVLTDSIQAAFDDLFDDVYAEVDVYVQAPSPIDDITTAQPGQGPSVPADLLDDLRAVEGVAEATGYIEGLAQFLDEDGDPVGQEGPPRLAESYDPLGPVDIAEGRAPEGPGEVAVDRGTASLLELELGDTTDVYVGGSVRTFDVVGFTSFGDSDNLLGASIATFDLATAQDLLGMEGRFTALAATADEGVDAEELRDRVATAVGDRFDVVTAAEEAASGKEEVAGALGFLTTALLAFAGVSVFVGAFIIANTFSIVVAQRSREFALLRALGATQRQVRVAVVLEALAVGVFASTLGLLAGIGFAALLTTAMASFGFELPSSGSVVLPRTVVVAYLVGVGITVLSSLSASRRASRVAPLEAMRQSGAGAEQRLHRRVVGGGALTAVGVAVLLVGLLVDVESLSLSLVGGGALATLLGVALMAPLFAGPVAALLGGVAARLGFSGRLAQRNARRDRRRTAATASALMIGVALVTFVTILTASIQGAVADTLTDQFRADFIVQSASFTTQNLTDDVVDDLRARDELATVSPLRVAPWADEAGEASGLGVVDAATITDVLDLEWGAEQREALERGELLASDEVLEAGRYAIGDEVTLRFVGGQSLTTTVGAASGGASPLLGSELVIDESAMRTVDAVPLPVVIYVSAAGDVEAARAAVDEVVDRTPGVRVQDQAEFRAEQERSIDTILNLFLALLALALFVALLGIANTLALAVFERTREIGLLRAVGMDRGQTGRMIVWEAVIVSIFGAVLGLVVGAFFGAAVVRSLADDGLTAVVVPGGRLLVYVFAAGAAGAVAALFPAWRASRIDVLQAVTAE